MQNRRATFVFRGTWRFLKISLSAVWDIFLISSPVKTVVGLQKNVFAWKMFNSVVSLQEKKRKSNIFIQSKVLRETSFWNFQLQTCSFFKLPAHPRNGMWKCMFEKWLQFPKDSIFFHPIFFHGKPWTHTPHWWHFQRRNCKVKVVRGLGIKL